ncbi:MAG TPA: protein kinase [Pseudomonadota bacterium]|nr:protein kinase [Pseudomonadota bacterium]
MAPQVAASSTQTASAAPEPAVVAPAETAAGEARPAGSYERIGPYRVLRMIGQGGMGTVYEGLRAGIDRRVAIKILHPDLAAKPDARARLYREASAVNRVGHPGLAEVTEVEHLPDGGLYLVMEYLRGETLAARLARSGGLLPLHTAVQLGIRLADILVAAHAHGVVHRDIKPSNIMLVPDSQMPDGERLKLIDFGIAKLASETLSPTDKTPQDTVLGTPDYMSPEQCSNSPQIDGQSDVYTLGAVLFHVIAGRPPFVADTPRLVMAKHQLESAPALSCFRPQAPEVLVTLIGRMLAKFPSQRPTSDEVIAQLRPLLTGGPEWGQAAARVSESPLTPAQETLADAALAGHPVRGARRWLRGVAAAALMFSSTALGWQRWLRPRTVVPPATPAAASASEPPGLRPPSAVIVPVDTLPAGEPKDPAPSTVPPATLPPAYKPAAHPLHRNRVRAAEVRSPRLTRPGSLAVPATSHEPTSEPRMPAPPAARPQSESHHEFKANPFPKAWSQ